MKNIYVIKMAILLLLLIINTACGNDSYPYKEVCTEDADINYDKSSFVTVWRVELGSLPEENIFHLFVKYNTEDADKIVVNWGDGIIEHPETDNHSVTHSYSQSGIYQIEVEGPVSFSYSSIPYYFDMDNIYEIVEIKNWGSLVNAYISGAKNLIITASDIPDLSGTDNTDNMFTNCSSIKEIPNINSWNMSTIESMYSMFEGVLQFNQNINSWDTSSVEDMSSMFEGAILYNQDMNNWNTSSVINMNQMFRHADSFNQNLNNWDTSFVTNMKFMFEGAVLYNQDMNNWNTSQVLTFWRMFKDAAVFNGDIGNWNTANAFNMSAMFKNATAFNRDIGNWNTSSVQYMTSMFEGAVSFDQNLGAWNVENVKDMTGMFKGVTLSTDNYSSILTSWAMENVQDNVVFDGGNSMYNQDAETARSKLINDHYWIITDGGLQR